MSSRQSSSLRRLACLVSGLMAAVCMGQEETTEPEEAEVELRVHPSALRLENEKKWLADANALGIPEGLVKTLKEYSRDPEVLYAWRNRMGDLIDESGMVDVNPWGTHFNARGFESN